MAAMVKKKCAGCGKMEMMAKGASMCADCAKKAKGKKK